MKNPRSNPVDYNIQDPDFRTLMQLLALSTRATFAYTPTDDDIITSCKDHKIALPKQHKHSKQSILESVPIEQKEEILTQMLNEEAARGVGEKKVQGDASETGVIRFVEGVLRGMGDGLE